LFIVQVVVVNVNVVVVVAVPVSTHLNNYIHTYVLMHTITLYIHNW